jgi:hypothetical protein
MKSWHSWDSYFFRGGKCKDLRSYASGFPIGTRIKKINYPFKFNLVWLTEPDFVKLVRTKWHRLVISEISSPMDTLVLKLKMLKYLVISWERNKIFLSREELPAGSGFRITLHRLSGVFEREEDKVLVAEMEKRKWSF